MRIKNKNPIEYLNGKNAHCIIQVYFELNQLKQLYRQGWFKRSEDISDGKCESVADHCFGMTMLSYFIADEFFPELDTNKVMRMVLIHEFGEIYAGDVTPLDNVSSGDKYQLEKESVEKVLLKLPKGKEYVNLWEEYEKQESLESRFVKQMDKLEMVLQASVYKNHGYNGLDPFFEVLDQIEWDSKLNNLIEEIKEMVK